MTFNVRVYGILVDDKKGVLVSDELIRGKKYLKFPGGGLEYGEGTRDCLKREFMEEMNLKIEVKDHIYTTDFFQESAFRPNDQIISVYYYVDPVGEISFPFLHKEELTEKLKAFPHADEESFSFIPKKDFSPDIMDLPIDKVVARIISKDW